MYYFRWVADEPVCHLRDVDQTVLVDADVYKGAKVNHIAHRPCENHPRLQIPDCHHIPAEKGSGQLLPGVPARLFQLPGHVPQGGNAHAAGGSRLLPAQGIHLLAKTCKRFSLPEAQKLKQLLCSRVGFRMDPGVVQQLRLSGTRRKPAHCWKAFGPSLGTFSSCFRPVKGAVCLPVGHNVPGCGGIQACYLGQKTGGGGVDVYPPRRLRSPPPRPPGLL